MSLTFYYCPGSSSMAPHIALNEVGATFEGRLISLKAKENRSAAYLAVNPEGKVPTLVVDGRRLTEVAGILFFLGKTFPEASLLPNDAEGQAQIVSWMSFIAATVHPARRQGEEHARKIYELAERRLGSADWAMGRAYSIADIHLFRLYWRFRGTFPPESGALPGLEAHYARMMARPAVQKVLEVEAVVGRDLPA